LSVLDGANGRERTGLRDGAECEFKPFGDCGYPRAVLLLRPRTNLRKRPQQERAAASVEAIIEAARRLVVSQGADAFTMSELLQLAGVSPGTLYQYFPDREAILSALIDRLCDDFAQRVRSRIAELRDLPLAAFLDRLAQEAVQASDEHRELKSSLRVYVLKRIALGELEDSSDDYARLLAAALEHRLGADSAKCFDHARAMVWAADGILEGFSRSAQRPASHEVGSRILGAWNGILAG
jgi:AcrR family transcriptional regulator